MTIRFVSKPVLTAAALMFAACASHAGFTAPNANVSFNAGNSPDLNPSPFVTVVDYSQVSRGEGRELYGHAEASVLDGTVRTFVSSFSTLSGAPNSVPALTGYSAAAVSYDTITASTSGYLTLTLTGHAVFEASSDGPPVTGDDSWAQATFSAFGTVYERGGVRGGGTGRGSAAVGTNLTAPSRLDLDSAPSGRANRSRSLCRPRGDGGDQLDRLGQCGDEFHFGMQASSISWSDLVRAAYAESNGLNTGRLSISGSPGMSWTSESGVLLSAKPVPEPASWLMLGLGLAALRLRRG